MPKPIEALDRPSLERRYRRMRLATVILAGVSLLLVAALGSQGLQGRGAAKPDSSASQGENNGNAGAGSGTDADTAAQSCPVVDRLEEGDPRALGDIDAPVVLHEWTDFRCPYCASFSRDTLPVLIEEYVETGKVRLEIHDAALVGGENSILIASASRAAGEQGKYFEFYDEVYHAPETAKDANGEFNLPTLVAFAKKAGVSDIEKFTEAVESGKFEADVRAETAEAQSIGVTGVPFFATTGCGQVMSGAQPVDTFREQLDAAVAAAEQK
ncbi:thioredoxin domain-containing protein [Leucobacter sp. BZR 635]